MRNLLLFAAILFSVAACSNPVSQSATPQENADTLDTIGGITSGRYVTIEGTFGPTKPDTLEFESGRYRTHLFYMDTPKAPGFWEMRTEIEINYDAGKLVFKSWGPNLNYRVMLFE